MQYKEVFDFGNLYKAFRLSKRGKTEKKSVAKYEVSVLENLITLQEKLRNLKYEVGEYNVFYIYEPKKRKIMSNDFEDKIVQHSFCDNIASQILNKKLIYDNAANQKGKGTKFAIERTERHLRRHYINHGLKGYILKCDIHKYFDSIRHDVVKRNTLPHFKDYGSKWLWNSFIESVEGVGVPMGNLSSQSHAITVLDPIDQMVKRELRIKGYVRYVDDFILIHEDKQYLKYCKERIVEKLTEMGLELNPKSDIFPIKNGVDFLGFHIYLTETGKIVKKIRRKSKTNVRRKLRYFKKNLNTVVKGKELTINNVIQSYVSWRGHAGHGDCYYLIRKMDRYFLELFSEELKGIKHSKLEEIKENVNLRKEDSI